MILDSLFVAADSDVTVNHVFIHLVEFQSIKKRNFTFSETNKHKNGSDMSKLSKLYSMIANAQELGIELGEDVYRQTDKLEEEIIKKEILPVIKEQIEPTLRQIKRDLTLVVDYVPDVSIRVRLSRESGIYNQEDFVELTPDPQAEHGTRRGGNNIRRAPKSAIKIRRRDNTVLQEATAAETLDTPP